MAQYKKDKLYWFKLKDDFFKRHDIKIIKAMPNGKDYVIFYLQLLCESLSHNGKLRFSNTIPYNEEMLSIITDTNIDTVRSAMKLLTGLGLVEVLDDKTIYMTTLQNMVGSSTIGADKKQIQLQKRAEYVEGGKKVENLPPDIEIEKDIEIDIKESVEKKARFTPPTTEEVKAYIATRKTKINADRFINYYESNGWKVGKNPMKDWKAAVRTWEQPKEQSQQPESKVDEYHRIMALLEAEENAGK